MAIDVNSLPFTVVIHMSAAGKAGGFTLHIADHELKLAVFNRLVDLLHMANDEAGEKAVWIDKDQSRMQMQAIDDALTSEVSVTASSPSSSSSCAKSLQPVNTHATDCSSSYLSEEDLVGFAFASETCRTTSAVLDCHLPPLGSAPGFLRANHRVQAQSCNLPIIFQRPPSSARRVSSKSLEELPVPSRSLDLPDSVARKYDYRFAEASRSLDAMPALREGAEEDRTSPNSVSDESDNDESDDATANPRALLGRKRQERSTETPERRDTRASSSTQVTSNGNSALR